MTIPSILTVVTFEDLNSRKDDVTGERDDQNCDEKAGDNVDQGESKQIQNLTARLCLRTRRDMDPYGHAHKDEDNEQICSHVTDRDDHETEIRFGQEEGMIANESRAEQDVDQVDHHHEASQCEQHDRQCRQAGA